MVILGEMARNVLGGISSELSEGISSKNPIIVCGGIPSASPGIIRTEDPLRIPSETRGVIWRAIHEGIPGKITRAVPKEICDSVHRFISGQTHNNIPRGLPSKIPVAWDCRIPDGISSYILRRMSEKFRIIAKTEIDGRIPTQICCAISWVISGRVSMHILGGIPGRFSKIFLVKLLE